MTKSQGLEISYWFMIYDFCAFNSFLLYKFSAARESPGRNESGADEHSSNSPLDYNSGPSVGTHPNQSQVSIN